MKVYVLETGPWEAQGIYGIYTTPEAAMAAWPKGTWEKLENDADRDLWCLVNGSRLADAAKITGYYVEGERPNPVTFSDAGKHTVTWPIGTTANEALAGFARTCQAIRDAADANGGQL